MSPRNYQSQSLLEGLEARQLLAASNWRGSSASSRLDGGLLRGLIDLSSSLA